MSPVSFYESSLGSLASLARGRCSGRGLRSAFTSWRTAHPRLARPRRAGGYPLAFGFLPLLYGRPFHAARLLHSRPLPFCRVNFVSFTLHRCAGTLQTFAFNRLCIAGLGLMAYDLAVRPRSCRRPGCANIPRAFASPGIGIPGLIVSASAPVIFFPVRGAVARKLCLVPAVNDHRSHAVRTINPVYMHNAGGIAMYIVYAIGPPV